MCRITQATIHSCGHARTNALIAKCADSIQTGRKCPVPPPTVIADSKCWNCLRAQIGQAEFGKHLLDSLVVPETTVVDGRVEEDWMEMYDRKRERRLMSGMGGVVGRVE